MALCLDIAAVYQTKRAKKLDSLSIRTLVELRGIRSYIFLTCSKLASARARHYPHPSLRSPGCAHSSLPKIPQPKLRYFWWSCGESHPGPLGYAPLHYRFSPFYSLDTAHKRTNSSVEQPLILADQQRHTGRSSPKIWYRRTPIGCQVPIAYVIRRKRGQS